MTARIRTGIYGGSFNPIHNGHIAIAKSMLEGGMVDEVWMMVSPQNPLKPSGSLADDKTRLGMAKAALEGVKGVEACSYEFGLPRPSYTWNTLCHLSADYPNREFKLMIGADNWLVFDRWRNADDILKHYSILIYPRRGSEINAHSLPANVSLADTGLYDVSSTMVRSMVKKGIDISPFVPRQIVGMVENIYK